MNKEVFSVFPCGLCSFAPTLSLALSDSFFFLRCWTNEDGNDERGKGTTVQGCNNAETIRLKLLKQITIDLFLVIPNLATDGLCFLKPRALSQESIW